MKIGSIYKFTHGNKTITGILVKKVKRYQKECYQIISTSGNFHEITPNEETKTTSTKLTKELREVLKESYKKYAEKSSIEEKILQMQKELQNKQTELETELKKVKKISDEFIMEDFTRNFRDINRYSTNPDNPTFSFYLKKQIEKYARPDDYPFLTREYDGSIHIWDDEACIKKHGLKLAKSDVENLKKQLKYTKLEGIHDACDIGDKSTLYVNKILDFSIKKGVKYSEIMQEGKVIKEWLDERKNTIGN